MENELDFGIKLKLKVCSLQWYENLILPKVSLVPCFVGVHHISHWQWQILSLQQETQGVPYTWRINLANTEKYWKGKLSVFYGEAPELLCHMMPDFYVHDPRLRWSVRSHDLAVEVLRSNFVSHSRSFLPSTSTAQLWNSLPAQIPAIRSRASFSREVNRFLGATLSAASEWFLFLLLMPSYVML